MSEKKVKVVKRAERGKNKAGNARVAREAARKAASEMVTTVSNWVNELQQRRRAETTEAIRNLVRARRQQPNEA